VQRLSTIGAGGQDGPVLVDHGEQAEGIPDAIGPPFPLERCDAEGGCHGREKTGHVDLAALRLRNEDEGLREALVGDRDLFWGEGEFVGRLLPGWCGCLAEKVVVDRSSNHRLALTVPGILGGHRLPASAGRPATQLGR
jgi:hypothetical protein